jgi:hypothetical protein
VSANLMFDGWLESTRILQTHSYGADPAKLVGEAQVEYVRWNMLALIKELMESLDECSWKPWSVSEKGLKNRDAFVDELVDVAHFLANLLVAANCSDEEFHQRYTIKQQVNRERMASGTYQGVNGA